MSEEFLALRVQARQRRDAAIEAAREEYEATLTQIETLQQRLGKQVPRAKRGLLAAAVDSVLPHNHEFTIPDVMRALEVR